MPSARSYTKVARAAAEEATRAALLDAAEATFYEGGWTRTSLERIAVRGGTTKQTLLRHFGSKDGLLEAAYRRAMDRVRAQRFAAPPDDVEAAVDNRLDHYAAVGEASLRIASLTAEPGLAHIAEGARRLHHEWVEHVFGGRLRAARGTERARLRAGLIVACDVQTWGILAGDLGLARAEVRATLLLLIRALLGEGT
jgi:AcrR family transcriptional regulator